MAMMQAPRRIFLAMILLAAPVVAQDSHPVKATKKPKEVYDGSDLFKSYCASCHGSAAKGDGPLADRLRVRPPDLTLLARQNKGKWDGEMVARKIDGREPVKGHGGADMPAWGDVLKNSRDGFDEESVKEKVRALVEHIESLQAPSDKP